jgi:hypothetical protein
MQPERAWTQEQPSCWFDTRPALTMSHHAARPALRPPPPPPPYSGMVALLQKVLQLYASRQLSQQAAQQAGGDKADAVLSELLEADESQWAALVRQHAEHGDIRWALGPLPCIAWYAHPSSGIAAFCGARYHTGQGVTLVGLISTAPVSGLSGGGLLPTESPCISPFIMQSRPPSPTSQSHLRTLVQHTRGPSAYPGRPAYE